MGIRHLMYLTAALGVSAVTCLYPAHATSTAMAFDDCGGCQETLTLTPPSGSTGSVIVCPGGERARLVLSVVPSDGACIRHMGNCLASACEFTTSLSYGARGTDVDIIKSTGFNPQSIGIFPDTTGALVGVPSETGLVWHVDCGLGIFLEYSAVAQACANPTVISVGAAMQCSGCGHI
jgi:hypothetical protein